MKYLHRIFLQIRLLKLQKAQMIILKDLDYEMRDLEKGYCDKIDKSPINLVDLLRAYMDGVEKRDKVKGYVIK